MNQSYHNIKYNKKKRKRKKKKKIKNNYLNII